MNRNTLLLGIGNLVLTDDGFGVHCSTAAPWGWRSPTRWPPPTG